MNPAPPAASSSAWPPQQRPPPHENESGLDVKAHARDFFDCIKSRKAPAANATVMRHSHIACHAAALSWMLARKLELDPESERFINHNEAKSLRARPARDRAAAQI